MLPLGKSGTIMQASWIVDDLEAAVDHWIRIAKVGPFFCMRSASPENYRYRGQPGTLDIALLASRQNAIFSLPMLVFMIGATHFPYSPHLLEPSGSKRGIYWAITGVVWLVFELNALGKLGRSAVWRCSAAPPPLPRSTPPHRLTTRSATARATTGASAPTRAMRPDGDGVAGVESEPRRQPAAQAGDLHPVPGDAARFPGDGESDRIAAKGRGQPAREHEVTGAA